MAEKRLILISFALLCFLSTSGLRAEDTPCGATYKLGGNTLGSVSNPVKCDSSDGEIEYLRRLRDSNGNPVQYKRIGHECPAPNGHVLDKFIIKAADRSLCAEIYMDMYCPGVSETQPIKGFQMASPQTPPLKPSPQVKNPPVNPPSQTKPKPQPTIYHSPQLLTAFDVYLMVADNGFYCETTDNNIFHKQGLKEAPKPINGIFKSKRSLSTFTDGLYITSQSTPSASGTGTGSSTIDLTWKPKPRKYSYKKAMEAIKELNKKEKHKTMAWRIPTIMELFSIVEANNDEHLLPAFKIPTNKTMVLWSSTQVKKKGTVLEPRKNYNACYVINREYDSKSKRYSLTFSYKNMDSKKVKAYLLPVMSSREYRYTPKPAPLTKPMIHPPAPRINKPVVNQGIPGFDDNSTTPPPVTRPVKPKPKTPTTSNTPTTSQKNEKIPGFDDSPTKKKTPKNKPTASTTTRTNQSISPGTLPIAGFDDNTPVKKKFKFPSPLPAKKPSSPVSKLNPRKLNVTIFPYLAKGTLNRKQADLLNNLNTNISNHLQTLSNQLKNQSNAQLKIVKKDSFDPNQIMEITRLYNILNDPNLDSPTMMNNLLNRVMTPAKNDIIITVKHKPGNTSGMTTLIPTIISGIDKQIYKQSFIINNADTSAINKYIQDTLSKIIKNNI